MSFKPVTPQINFVDLEHEIIEWWEREGIVAKYLNRNNGSAEKFSFLDGPLTANNPMGVHHAWGRTYKDAIQRFHNLRGHAQRFQNGFDEQGLWVEVEVEKELGLHSKKDILNLVPGDEYASLEKFITLCKERVAKYSAVQTEQSKRLGYFMDWDNSYHTSSSENNYTIWHFLKVCHEKGWIYKGHDSVPWCPRCGTAISQMEILTEDYKEVVHESVYVLLPLVDRPEEKLLIWTTTPWTIPANVAVAIHPEHTYVLLKADHGLVWVSKEAAERLKLGGDIVQTKPGSFLVGQKYRGPFDQLPAVVKAKEEHPQTFHSVVAAKDLVMEGEGTGLVHIAPGAGAEDFKIGKDEKLSIIAPIDESAIYVDGFDFLSGQNAKKHPELILDYLREHESGEYMFKTERYKHRYPICWRCKTELVWRVVDEWYIAVDKPDASGKTYREQMVETAKNITWLPKWGLDRELDWLKNLGDWLISKKRFWGLALPIYEDTDGSFVVIGSYDELKELAVEGWEDFDGQTPHRPWIDKVKIKSPKTGAILSRIPDVGNPWLDAGIVPFSTIPEDWFPADFITESFPGQFKNWFYAIIAMATALKEERPDASPFRPTKTILGYATVRDEKGQEMHKSKGNSIEFNSAAEEVGAESMRWQYVTANPELNLNFGFGPAKQIQRQFFLIWWNVYNFFVTYANLDDWHPSTLDGDVAADIADQADGPGKALDLWILSRLAGLVQMSEAQLGQYDMMTPSRALEQFVVTDLSQWYIRRSRDRVGPAAPDEIDRESFYRTTYHVLLTVLKLGAPYLPFITDTMYRNLADGQSVHLSDWPSAGSQDPKLEQSMALGRQLVELGHAQRDQRQLKLKQPLRAAIYTANAQLPDAVAKLVAAELNTLEIEFAGQSDLATVTFDETMTEELVDMGRARSIIRAIQAERKKLGVRLDDRIVVSLPEWPKSQEAEIMRQTLADELVVGEALAVKLTDDRT